MKSNSKRATRKLQKRNAPTEWAHFSDCWHKLNDSIDALEIDDRLKAIRVVLNRMKVLEKRYRLRRPSPSIQWELSPRGRPGPSGQRYYWYASFTHKGERYRVYLGRGNPDDKSPPAEYRKFAVAELARRPELSEVMQQFDDLA